MSENNNALGGIIETFKNNPKAIYIVIGAIVIIAITKVLTGEGEAGKVQVKALVSLGQTVTLDNPNGGLSHITATPGLISASDAEEDSDLNICRAAAGSHATIEEEQVVGLLPYVKVSVLDGECQGKSGWTSKVNVKAGS
jgi:hypothetical protein